MAVSRYISVIKNLTKGVDISLREDYLVKRMGMNPFVSDFKIVVNRLGKRGDYRKEDGILVPIEYDVERDSKVSVYTHSDYRLIVANLSNSAKSLYLHLLYEVEYGCDYVEINVSRYMYENKIKSVLTYNSQAEELCRVNIICPVVGSEFKNVYWINPRLFFAGNRVGKYKDNLVMYKKKDSDNLD